MHESSDHEYKVYEALKPHLTPLESQPDVVGAGLGFVNDGYVVKIMVRDLQSATQNKVQDVIPSPLVVTLDDGSEVSLPVEIEETGQPVGQTNTAE